MGDYKKVHISTLLKYYKRPEIQQALIQGADNKEVAVSYGGTGYGKRPDMIKYPKDVLEAVKQGATSFHCSEELWKNPLQVTTGMKPAELNELRIGWDLILDIDCDYLEYSRIAADLIVQALRHHGIPNFSIKFSGNHGFHIGVPFDSFPETVNGTPVKDLFPEGPRKIAAYLQEMIRVPLTERLLKTGSVSTIAERIGKESNELLKNKELHPFAVVAIDTILIASRHLYRMPYSLNEKSGLASVVINPEEILTFNLENARPENVKPELEFLNLNCQAGEANKLFINAFDFNAQQQAHAEVNEIVQKQQKEYEPVLDAIPEQYFPPCIKKISQGLKDGKKRALFVLVNFLSSCGWSYDQMEEYLTEWNKRNDEPLREVTLLGQLRYHKQHKKKVLPPNCANKAYMVDIGVCAPDSFCRANSEPGSENFAPRIKNPANYSIARQRRMAEVKNEKTE